MRSSNGVQGAHKRYLRMDNLLPGDVFLSRGSGWESNRIAQLTFGPYSHASIYIHSGLLFEAIGDGVGYTGLFIARSCDKAGFLLDASRYRRLEIRRHPVLRERCLTAEGRREVSEALSAMLLPEYGKEYPLPTALAYAAPIIPWFVLMPFLWLLRFRAEERGKKAPGLFCSQLVVQALTRLHAYPLKPGWFGRHKTARQISPNHLQFSRSLLQPVSEVIVDETFACDQPEEDPQRERQRVMNHERLLRDMRDVQRHALGVMDKHAALKLRLALDNADATYENLRTPYQ